MVSDTAYTKHVSIEEARRTVVIRIKSKSRGVRDQHTVVVDEGNLIVTH